MTYIRTLSESEAKGELAALRGDLEELHAEVVKEHDDSASSCADAKATIRRERRKP